MGNTEYSVWAVAEHFDGCVRPVTYEVVAFAEKVADAVGGKVAVVVAGHPVQPLAETIAAETGCDVLGIDPETGGLNPLSVYNAEVYRQLLKKLFDARKPRYIFIPHTATGWDYAPALAVDIGASNITAVSAFKFDQGPVFSRQTCNGKIYEDVKALKDRPAVVTVMPGASPPASTEDGAGGSVEIVEMEVAEVRAKCVRQIEAPARSVNLQEAEVVVAAGRGIGDPGRLDMIRELAKLFERGAVGASRPVCDMGWIEFDCQVGMTGQTVAPKLYIAAGISGAVQHTMGMKNAKLIVSINTDKNSLFTQTAHYCIAADLHQFIPALIKRIRKNISNAGKT